IPSITQDWLVRPIKRSDLLLAKVLLVVLVIHAPMVVSNLLRGLAEGFAFGPSLGNALLSSFEVALLFTLPVMAIAALTRSLTEALIGSLILLFGLLLVRLLLSATAYHETHAFHFSRPVDGTGVAWIWGSLSHALLLGVTIAVLLLQYFRRTTLPSRLLFIAGLFLFMVTQGLPWQPAFAIQQWFAARPDAGRTVALTYDPSIATPDAAPVDSRLLTRNMNEKESKPATSKDTIPILLPLRFSGLPAGVVLHADRAAVHLLRADGRTLYRGTGRVFDLASPAGGEARLYHTIQIPTAVAKRAA